jgi:hypothetical protein
MATKSKAPSAKIKQLKDLHAKLKKARSRIAPSKRKATLRPAALGCKRKPSAAIADDEGNELAAFDF